MVISKLPQTSLYNNFQLVQRVWGYGSPNSMSQVSRQVAQGSLPMCKSATWQWESLTCWILIGFFLDFYSVFRVLITTSGELFTDFILSTSTNEPVKGRNKVGMKILKKQGKIYCRAWEMEVWHTQAMNICKLRLFICNVTYMYLVTSVLTMIWSASSWKQWLHILCT